MAGESGDFLRRLRRALLDWSAWKAGQGVERARQAGHDIARGGRFTCACGEKGCPGTFRSLRAQKAHAAKHAARQAGRWAGKSARAAGRAMGRPLDDARRHALSWFEAAGLREWKKIPVRDKDGNPVTGRNGKPLMREVPVKTDRARSRPALSGRLRIRDVRVAHRHDRDHEKADGHDRKAQGRHARAARSAARAAALRAAGRDGRAARHEGRAATHRDRAASREGRAGALRDRWTERVARAARHAPEPRPVPARTVPATGGRPEPARTPRPAEAARAAPADGNGTRPARSPRSGGRS